MKPKKQKEKMYKFLSKVLHSTLVFCLLFCLGVSLTPNIEARADQGGFSIQDYDVHAILHQDNTMEVTEVIEVDFYQARHGIYRTIPRTMTVGYTQAEKEADPLGTIRAERYSLKIKDISVYGAAYDVDSEDGETQIRIGSASTYVEGLQTYEIHYTIVYPKDYKDTRDFIFYSPLGASWDALIDHFSFTLDLDKPLSKEEMEQVKIYSGPYGSTNNDLNVDYNVQSNQISGTAENISHQNAITIFTSLHEGYFVNASSRSALPGFLAGTITIVIAFLAWLKQRQLAQKKYTETIEFYPPEGISSAQVGFFIDGVADISDLMSLIPYWGNQGYINLEETSHDSFLLRKEKPLPEDAPDYEQTLFDALFRGRDVVDMEDIRSSTSFAKSIISAQSQLTSSYKYDNQLSHTKGFYVLLGFLSLFGLLSTILLNTKGDWLVAIFCAIVIFAIIFTTMIIILSTSMQRHFARKQHIGLRFLLGLFALVGLVFVILQATGPDRLLPFYIPIITYVLVFITALGCYQFVAPTDYWYENAGKLAGLKTCIQKAEVPQLERLSKENPTYFFDVIPFAMAFGLSKQWSEAFKTIPLVQPVWYRGSRYNDSYYYYHMLDHGVSSPVTHSVSSYQAAQAASHSSSGGFSGGGGGGGGGGSW